jgi:hypothetical protein
MMNWNRCREAQEISVTRANTEVGRTAAGANLFGRLECKLIFGKSGGADL